MTHEDLDDKHQTRQKMKTAELMIAMQARHPTRNRIDNVKTVPQNYDGDLRPFHQKIDDSTFEGKKIKNNKAWNQAIRF